MTKRLEGKVAIVTGSGRGIGKAIAEVFAAEGAEVIAVGPHEENVRRTSAGIAKAGGRSSFLRGDISSWEEMREMAKVVVERYGRIDVLCQNAGITPVVPIEKMTEKDWDSVSDINLKGTFLAVRACLPQMIRQKYGRILVTSSVTGPRTAIDGLTGYAATKAGVNGFIRAAAVELGKYNITVNGVEPGTIMTDSTKAVLSAEQQRTIAGLMPLGRIGKPEDIAYAMLFLASDEASYITGQTIIVDGGSILPEFKI